MKLKTTLVAAALVALALPGQAMAAPKAKVRFATTSVVTSEGAGHAVVTVTRQPRNGKSKSTLTSAVSVNYSTSAGTAGPSDYTNVSGTLNFASGDTTESFLVPIAQDGNLEGPETVNLALSSPSRGAVIVNPGSAVLTIADDDGPVQVHFSAPSYSVSEFGPAAEITVVRTGQLRDAGNNPVTSTVDWTTVDGTAGGSDYSAGNGTLTFGADDVDETITVPITADSAVEGSEAFSVSLSNPTNAAFANAAASLSAPVTIVDDDTVSGAVELSFSAAAYSGAESGSGIAITIVRSGPVNKGGITADVDTADGTAVAGADYEALPDDELIEFDEGDITQTLVVATIDDSAVENDETLTVGLSGATGASLGTPATSTLTIADNDTTPVVVETPVEVPGETPATQVTEVTNVTNVTNTTTNISNPFAEQAGILVLGARLGACKLSVGTFKSQRVLRLKGLRVKIHAVEACRGNLKAHVTGRKSTRSAKKGAVQTKVVKYSLKAGQSKTVRLRFTKRGLALVKRALGKQKSLKASLLVRSGTPSKRMSLKTLRWTAKR